MKKICEFELREMLQESDESTLSVYGCDRQWATFINVDTLE
jgi:hypothetical protein